MITSAMTCHKRITCYMPTACTSQIKECGRRCWHIISSLSTTLSWTGVPAVNNTVMISLYFQNW